MFFSLYFKSKNVTLDYIFARPRAIMKLQVFGMLHACKHLKSHSYYLSACFNLPFDFIHSNKLFIDEYISETKRILKSLPQV